MNKELNVLTVLSSMQQGSYTYNVMSNGYIHINNHKTNSNSVIVSTKLLLELINQGINNNREYKNEQSNH